MGRRLAAAATLLVLAAGCGSHGAPDVKGKPFPSALARLRAHGWLVSVPSFPAWTETSRTTRSSRSGRAAGEQ